MNNKLDIKLMNIYNYLNEPMTIELEDYKNVSMLIVLILSGDETVRVVYNDGESVSFDSDTVGRLLEIYEGLYMVDSNEIDKWIEIGEDAAMKETLHAVSYVRQEEFLNWKAEKEG